MNSAPAIMVSSTFYDLRQIRKDLHLFISNELGYIPLISELPSFPVDPDVDTIENCRQKVEREADILVLIIGGRYGSINTKNDKSITNLEFLAARAKGIPIYAFIDKSILALLPVWKVNPNTNFSPAVDNPKLFDFIEFVRSEERVWTFEFEDAQDIITTLRLQLAYLMHDALKVRSVLNGSAMPIYLEGLRPKTLKIALEKPKYWEYYLLFYSWMDETECKKDLLRAYKVGVLSETSTYVPLEDSIEWLQTQLHQLKNFVASLNTIINKSLKEAFGKPGEPGNAEYIVWASRIIGSIYEKTISWAQIIRCARLDPIFDDVVSETALSADDLINEIEKFPRESLEKIENAINSTTTSEHTILELTFIMSVKNSPKLQETIEILKTKINR